MLLCPGWGLITTGWDVVCGGGPSSPSYKQRQELLSPCECCGVRRGEQVLCLVPASRSKSVNTTYTEYPCLNSQTIDTRSPCFFFFLVLVSPVISHSSALLFYPWRLKDPSCHLHPLHPNFFLCATQERPAAPPGLFISSEGAFGQWSHPSLPWNWGLGPGWRPRSDVLFAGDAPGQAVGHQPLLGLFLQARFTLGMFTVYPGFGSLPPGGQQVITVDCQAEPLGTCKEHLCIDISGRDPKDNPLGIPYTLFAESCLPGTPCS